ncbi:hypothetical protein HU200_058097 [Digitaria exilis]|uniref:non-specific serine/threonine protein kinase n=1 Tax=Digitaria exilis TaxID=1010633 RepID=A0A835AEC2_9POAL|nr:hypothetical protein HU200_058097 [Digitaria exilis]
MEEGVGESCWPPADAAAAAGRGASSPGGGGGYTDIRKEIFNRLMAKGIEEVVSDPLAFRDQLHRHFERLPASYSIDLDVEKAEDVLLHRRILDECADPDKRPVFHVRFITCVEGNSQDKSQGPSTKENGNSGGSLASTLRDAEFRNSEPCQRLMEDLNLERVTDDSEASSARKDEGILRIHEIIFSTVDQKKLLARLSALLSELGLNIREAHVFSTTDGFCLDVFVVDGWETEETDGLLLKLKEIVAQNHALFSNPTNSAASEKIQELQEKIGDSNCDRSSLHIREKIASGSSGDLFRGSYQGRDVAIKFLRAEHVDDSSKVEFLQEIIILKSVNHDNVVRFYGACTKERKYVIVTEYMAGGNLYDFLHKQKNTLEITMVIRIAIDISKGMDYLHQNNIVHRDLKTANLLLGSDHVVKIADFGVSRNPSQEGDMTAETGTYRWMAPEVINHKPYDHRADVFSFAIVLWELVTSKIPYENMTPLQAALGVRQGMRLEIPSGVHPRLSQLIQQCWDENPNMRPSFSEITAELEDILRQVQAPKGTNRHSKAKVLKKSQTDR